MKEKFRDIPEPTFSIILLLLTLASFSLGYLSYHYRSSISRAVSVVSVQVLAGQPERAESNKSADERMKNRFNQLNGLGYTAGVEAPSHSGGVTVHNEDKAFEGYNLYSSAHGPEAILTDMEGNVVHRWKLKFDQAFPNHLDGFGLPNSENRRSHWRKVHLLENGSLLAIYAINGIVKVDRNSNLIWGRYNYAHHDLTTGPEGDVYTITRNLQVPKWEKKANPILEDIVSVLGSDGYQVREHSIFQAFLRTDSESLLSLILRRIESVGDVFHTNAIKVYSRTDPRLPSHLKGQGPFALVSSKKLDTFGFIDLHRNKLRWAVTDMTKSQHDPRLLENGNVLVYDNDAPNGYSRVLEIDPVTKEIVWKFSGNESNQFYSGCCGVSQRLPNGNTLITDTNSGRTFEVTQDKEIVWEYYSPHRVGQDDQEVARLFHLDRIPEEYVSGWLKDVSP